MNNNNWHNLSLQLSISSLKKKKKSTTFLTEIPPGCLALDTKSSIYEVYYSSVSTFFYTCGMLNNESKITH